MTGFGDTWTTFECGTCGSPGLRIASIAGQPWTVTCLNGHPWVLDADTDVVFELQGSVIRSA